MTEHEPETEATPPASIGRYDVERLLGQGGMGRVWLARDRILGRRVAIKVLRDDLALPPRVREELVQRMRHEARAAAAVSHPNIVTLHDMGEDDEVGLYLVFEYVPGPNQDDPESLRDRLLEGPLDLEQLAQLARELGPALTFAHGAGVIHRDVKPENVLFSRTGAKIADFGIARIPESNITRANTVLGTPAYTAPEALSNGEFGPTSDQFSLAATLYEAASGVRAFGDEDPVRTAGKVSNDPAPPLDPSLGPPALIRALDTSLRRGLAKEPGERFASCQALGDAVVRAIDQRAVAALLAEGAMAFERTPLSSRSATLAKLSERPPAAPTPVRPSVLIRKRTHRFQNVIAAAALLVIIGLVVFGKKSSDTTREGAQPEGATSVTPPPPKARPAHVSGGARSSPATTADAGAELARDAATGDDD
jgi:eukaryotic-like serine/threonine-protein kinase